MAPVSSAKTEALVERMRRLGIKDEDLEERFIRSRGKGGQNVNKVATCVVLTHRPTGIMVRCQRERSQALNRFHARRLLSDKVERLLLGKASEEAARVARLRRQKRRRSRRAKEKILEQKRQRAEVKAGRARVSTDAD